MTAGSESLLLLFSHQVMSDSFVTTMDCIQVPPILDFVK